MQFELDSETSARLIELASRMHFDHEEECKAIFMQMISIISASMPELDVRNFRPEDHIEYFRVLGLKTGIISELGRIINERYAHIINYRCVVDEQIDLEQRKNLCIAFSQIFPRTEPDVIEEFVNNACTFYLASDYFKLKEEFLEIPVTIVGKSIICISKYNNSSAISSKRHFDGYGNLIITIHNEALYRIVQMYKRYPENEQVVNLYDVAIALVGKSFEHNEDGKVLEHNEDENSRTAVVLFEIEMHMSVICHGLDTNHDTHDGNNFLGALCNAFHFLYAFVFCLFNKNFSEKVTKYLADKKSVEDQQQKVTDQTLLQNEDEQSDSINEFSELDEAM